MDRSILLLCSPIVKYLCLRNHLNFPHNDTRHDESDRESRIRSLGTFGAVVDHFNAQSDVRWSERILSCPELSAVTKIKIEGSKREEIQNGVRVPTTSIE